MHIFNIFLFLVIVLFNVSSYAQERLVDIRLLPEKSTIEAGEDIWIGIEQSIAPDWHTYWKNPGDSGLAPRISWDLPDGFEIEDIQWPVPHKIPYPPLMNYGYEDSVLLLQKLKTPAVLPDGALTFNASIEVLVCKEECIPESGDYSFTLNDANVMAEDNSAYLTAAVKKLPLDMEIIGFYGEREEDLVWTIYLPDGAPQDMETDSLDFFHEEWGLVDNLEAVRVSFEENSIVLSQKRGDRPLEELENALVSGVLVVEQDDGGRRGYHVSLEVASADALPSGVGALALEERGGLSLAGALIFAVIGGLILNLMPCVFPVLSFKALSLVKFAEKHPGEARLHGLAYTLGVVLSFLVIAGGLMVLKSGGQAIGWGFQLQNPLVVGALAYLLFIIGLNLSGVFEFGNLFANTGGKLAARQGASGSFFTGVLAALVATPCTAPFMAGAIGYALVQPAFIGLLVFAALGFGLALPYLLLAFVPPLQKILPKPGAWMKVFRQFLAFPMFAAAVWLAWVVALQTGADGVTGLLSGMVLIAFGVWCFAHKPQDVFWRRFVVVFALVSFFGAFLAMPKMAVTSANIEALSFGEAFSQGKLDMLLEGDAPVFVEMTAAWCITCKINHAAAIDVASTRDLFAAYEVRYLIGDWTNEDPMITAFLERYGRNGVPLYIFYGTPDAQGVRPEPKVLPQVLTPALMKKIIQGS